MREYEFGVDRSSKFFKVSKKSVYIWAKQNMSASQIQPQTAGLHPLLQKFSAKEVMGWEEFHPSGKSEAAAKTVANGSISCNTQPTSHPFCFDLKSKLNNCIEYIELLLCARCWKSEMNNSAKYKLTLLSIS